MRTRDLKENLDSTNVWLNEIDNIYLSSTNFEMLLIDKDDQFDTYERLRADLKARKEILLSKTTGLDSSTINNKCEIQQIIEKLETVLNLIEMKTLKTKNLQALMDEFNSNYENLNLFIRNAYVQFEEIERNTKQPDQSIIEQIYSLETSVKENNKIDDQLKPCIEKIRAQFSPELISSEKLKLLEQDSFDLNLNFENLSHICAAKIDELNKIQNLTTNYNDLRLKLNEWLHEARLKTQAKINYKQIQVNTI